MSTLSITFICITVMICIIKRIHTNMTTEMSYWYKCEICGKDALTDHHRKAGSIITCNDEKCKQAIKDLVGYGSTK